MTSDFSAPQLAKLLFETELVLSAAERPEPKTDIDWMALAAGFATDIQRLVGERQMMLDEIRDLRCCEPSLN